jgi:hypothetical protein
MNGDVNPVGLMTPIAIFGSFPVSAYPTAVLQTPDKAVILSEALRRSIADRALFARSRRTPAMLVGRCSRELSGRMVGRSLPPPAKFQSRSDHKSPRSPDVKGMGRASSDLSLKRFTAVTAIDLNSVTYKDGATWHASSPGACSTIFDLIMLVAAAR